MINFLFATVLAAGPAATNPQALAENILGIPHKIATILLAIDCLFMLYVAFGKNEKFKEYLDFILLAHGSVIGFGNYIVRFKLHNIVFYVFLAAVVIGYYFACKYEVFRTIITIANTIVMSSVVISSLLGTFIGDINTTAGVSLVVALVIFGLLAYFYFDVLYKLHTLFVCYLVTGFLIDALFDLGITESEKKDGIKFSLSFGISILMFGILTYLVFF